MPGPWEEFAAAPAPAKEEAGPWSDFQEATPGQNKPSSRWAQAGKWFNPAMRTALGFASGGFVGAMKGGTDALQQMAEPVKPQKVASSLTEDVQAGWQGSAAGLLMRGRLPDVVLDPQHAKWYDKLLAGGGQLAGDFPAMVVGGAAAGAAAIPSGPGAVVAGGAAAFATPTAIREALTLAYSLDQVQSSGDFLARTGMGILRTGKDAVVGGLTAGVGGYVAKAAAPLGAVKAGVLSTGAEVGVMTIAPAALEGRLPEPEDFTNGAIMVGGMKGAHIVAAKLRTIYAKTGVEPAQVVADAQADPELKAELQAPEGPQFKSQVSIVDSTSYQGQRQGALLGPNDQHLVARDPATGKDLGRLWVTQTETGFEVRKVEVDPAARGKDVATQLYLEAWSKFGPYEGSTDTTPDGKALLAKLQKNHPGIFEPDAAPEVPKAYQEMAQQQNAQDAVPGLAQEVGHEFFGPVRIPGEPTPQQVNYKYLNTPEDVNGALIRLSELNRAEIESQRRGEVPWEQTQAEAGKYVAELLGSTEPVQPRQPGTAAGAAEILARKQILEGAANDVAAKAREIKELGTNATPEHQAEFLAAIDRLAMIHSEFLGARAEAGRALNILKETKVAAERAEQIQQILKKFDKTPADLAEVLSNIDDPAALIKAASKSRKATTEQKLLEIWRAFIISGPVTYASNLMGNTTYMSLRPLVDLGAATGGLLTGQADRVHFATPLNRINGNLMGVMDGLKLARVALSVDSMGGKAESHNANTGTFGHIVRTPFRLLESADELFRSMNERGEAYAIGGEQAAREGFNPASREYRERMVEIANNPTEAQITQIESFGKRSTFKEPLGEKGKAIGEAIVKNHLEWVVPFRVTPTNIFKELFRLSPVAPIIGEWRADFEAGGQPRAKALAEMAIGSGIGALTMSMAMAGHVSGNGDPDPNKRRLQMAAGWQPYSVKINGIWHSYQRFQPVGTLVGMAADISEVWQHMTPEESDKAVKMLAVAFANAVTNQTFLQGISTFVDAIAQPDRKGPRLVQNMAGSLIPAAIGQTAQLTDPYQREVNSIVEAVKNRIPGVREGLTPQRDPFGEPVASPDRLGWISPVVTKDQSTDKVRTEAARLSELPGSTLGAGKAPKTIQMPTGGIGGKLGQVQLTPEQRDIFGDVAGHMAYNVMHGMVNSPGWDYMPDLVKEKAFKVAFEKSNQMGKYAALTDEQRAKEVQRIVTEVSKKLHPPVQ